MATASHLVRLETLTPPKVTPESVALRYGLSRLGSLPAHHEPLTFPQLKVLSTLYKACLTAIEAQDQSFQARRVATPDLHTHPTVLRKLQSLGLITQEFNAYGLVYPRGADFYELQWYYYDYRRKSKRTEPQGDPVNKPPRQTRQKLTPAEVQAIRASKDPVSFLARRYGVSPGTISNVRHRVTYKEVE